MSEPVCFPVCPKCKDGCELSSAVKSSLKSGPADSTKVSRWRTDIVELVCGQTVPSPIFMLGNKTQIWCETHAKWETLKTKKTTKSGKWRESPIDEIPF